MSKSSPKNIKKNVDALESRILRAVESLEGEVSDPAVSEAGASSPLSDESDARLTEEELHRLKDAFEGIEDELRELVRQTRGDSLDPETIEALDAADVFRLLFDD